MRTHGVLERVAVVDVIVFCGGVPSFAYLTVLVTFVFTDLEESEPITQVIGIRFSRIFFPAPAPLTSDEFLMEVQQYMFLYLYVLVVLYYQKRKAFR